jgi:hypothetical protein
VVLRLVVCVRWRLNISTMVSLRAGFRTMACFDRAPSHPNAQNPDRLLSAHIHNTFYRSSFDLLQYNRQNQHQRSKRFSRTSVPVSRLSCHYQQSKPEDIFQHVEDGVGFGACPFVEAVRVFCQHLVGDDEE